MKAPFTMAITALAVMLAGCDGPSPAGAGAGAADEQKSAVTQNLDRLKALSQAREQGLTQQTPLLPLLVRAIEPLVTQADDDQVGLAECAQGENPAVRADHMASLTANGIDVASIPVTGNQYSLLVHGTTEQLLASCAGRLVLLSTKPVNGWPNGGFTQEAKERMAKYARSLYQMGSFSAALTGPVLNTLSRKMGYTTAELEELARVEWLENAGKLRAANLAEAARINALPLSAFRLDMTGSAAPVHAINTIDRVDITADQYGVKLVRDGVEVYGAGYVAGTRYMAETVVSSSATIARSSSTQATTEAANRTTTNAEAKTQ